MFFSEEKNQKTFMSSAAQLERDPLSSGQPPDDQSNQSHPASALSTHFGGEGGATSYQRPLLLTTSPL
jgi:hypothetical protein